MVSIKKQKAMARKWRKLVSNQKKIVFPNNPKADKGHFVIYSIDARHFELPLKFLENDIFRELFKLAEEEYGFMNNGPTRLPREAALIEYVILLIQAKVAEDVDKALLLTVAANRCQSSLYFQLDNTNINLLSGF